MTLLRVEAIAKHYGQTTAVSAFSHEFADGEVTTIVGPSGSGKSTTLWMIAGLTAPDGGRVLIDGADVTGVPAEKRDIGIVFQNYALFPHLDAVSNVEFGLRVRGVPAAERRRRAMESLELVRMAPMARRRIAQLSGGEQQRVALARALSFRPKILLMDEPLSALDAKLREELRGELSRLFAELRLTTVYVTHDRTEAMALGRDLIVMRDGKIEQSGAPIDVYGRPATPFVAGFLGSANIIDAVVKDGEVVLPFATFRSQQKHPPGSYQAMFRPEDLEIDASGPGDFQTTLQSVLFLGNQLRLTLLTCTGHTLTADVRGDVRIDGRSPLPIRLRAQNITLWSANDPLESS